MTNLASYIDHTLLRPDATAADIRKLCEEAQQYGFASVCVNPYWVKMAAAELADSPVKVCTVIGFPLGASSSAVKVFEAQAAMGDGAREIDMVINIGELKAENLDSVRSDIHGVVEVCHHAGAIVKVILEASLLTDAEKQSGAAQAKAGGADFVKTSTGFSTGGATEADVRLLRATVGSDMGVKASGGIRTLADMEKMIAAGASRIGASAGVKIMEAVAGRIPDQAGGASY